MAKRRPIETEKKDRHTPINNPTEITQQIVREAEIQAAWQQSHRPIQVSRDNR